jgi:hypothetical protein
MEGQTALDNKSYATAEDRFRRADKLVHAPTLELGLARALAAEAKYVEAQETYNRIIREGLPPGAPEVFKRAVEDAKKEVDSVAPKLGSVVITVKAASGNDVESPKVTLDGKPVNAASLGIKRAIDPGPHNLHVAADGYKAADVSFSILEGGSGTQAVTLDKDAAAVAATTPEATPSTTPGTPNATPASGAPGAGSATAPDVGPPKKSILPWVAFGIGGAGLLAGGITGVIALGDHSKLAKDCMGGTCPASSNNDLSGYHAMSTISTVGFIVAGVGGAAGLVLLLTQPKGDAPPASAEAPAREKGRSASTAGLRLYPVLGLGSAGVSGTF